MSSSWRRCAAAATAAVVTLAACAGLSGAAAQAAAAAPDAAPTTAWDTHAGAHGEFDVDTANLVRSSDVVAQSVPAQGKQSMPLGNGVFGAAVWAQGGFTAQLNRDDTMPDRRSAGQLVIPGLAAMTAAPDYSATLDLYDGTYRQAGGGMTATTYVRADKDEIVTDVTGADPATAQTAGVDLQAARTSTSAVTRDGHTAVLSSTWVDTASASGGTGKTFGTLAAVSAGGRDVTASAPDSHTAQVSFTPNSDGSFRVVALVPHWAGGNAPGYAQKHLGADASAAAADLSSAHLAWWHDFWSRANLVKLTSADGVADYIGNLRTIYLYVEAASERGRYPSTQAGVNDLFNFTRDTQQWGGGQFWFWNLRMDLAANISSGLSDFNAPFFGMYRRDLPATEAWTRAQFPNTKGICLPETMRFDGTGWYVGTSPDNASCYPSETSYNAKTLTSGAELGSWIWRQYQQTDDLDFLRTYYPLIAEPAQFLLSYAKIGDDGKLHTYPSNAHETQWDVHDPITDLSAMKMIFPIVVQAATALHKDAGLVRRLQRAIPLIPDLPRTDAATHKLVKTAADDGDGNTVLAYSADPSAPYRNNENLDLEPVWPYNLIGDTSPQYDLAKATYAARQFRNSNTWTYDPVQAARLDLGDEVAATLKLDASTHSQYPDGLAAFSSSQTEPYDETVGVTALTVNESLATDYDGLLRIAPAIPTAWNAEGTVSIQHRSKVHVQVSDGQVTTAVIDSGAAHDVRVRNPWAGQQVQVVRNDGTVVVAPTDAQTLSFHADADQSYIVEQPSAPLEARAFAPLTADPATAPRHLADSTAVIGIDPGTSTTPCASPTQPVLLSWDPTSGATVTDSSGLHRDASFVQESPTYVDGGPTGSAAELTGGGYLSGSATSLGYLTAATFATEINATDGSTYRRIWDWKSSGGGDDDGFILDLTPSGQLRIITAGVNHTFSSTLPTGQWVDLVVTVDTDGTALVYENGRPVESYALGNAGINGCATGSPHIGADQGGGQAITADVDRSAVFSRALTADEVGHWQSLATG